MSDFAPDWSDVFEHLEKSKERLLRQTLVVGGRKQVFEKEEMVFFLGKVRCVLTMKGWRFEIQ